MCWSQVLTFLRRVLVVAVVLPVLEMLTGSKVESFSTVLYVHDAFRRPDFFAAVFTFYHLEITLPSPFP